MYCENCGKEIKNTAKFCAFCGSPNEYCIGKQATTTSDKANDTTCQMKRKTNARKSNDIMTEISRNMGLLMLPVIFLAWQILRVYLNRINFRETFETIESYETYIYGSIFLSCVLYGLALGGLVIAVQRCSKNFKWVYIIPICMIDIYYIVNSGADIYSKIMTVCEFSEIFVAMGIVLAMKRICGSKGNNQMAITIIAVITAAFIGILYRAVCNALACFALYGQYSIFDGWELCIGTATVLGTLIPSTILFNFICKKDNKEI